jgi:DNA topoisomerase IB
MEDLVYVHGGEPGFRRERRDGGFVYFDADGELVSDPATLERIRALAIPPAWTDARIAASPNAHLQATGLDRKGRRQYLYHPVWRERRDKEKFHDMLDFAERLPQLRQMVKGLLGDEQLSRDRTIALALRLLDVGMFRVGWDRYARDNGHVGLTTLCREHVRVDDTAAQFDFVAKHGKRRRMTIRDPESVHVLARLKRRRGAPEQLLVYREPRAWRRVHAADVNNALRCWGEGPFSAKEFRTWAATVLAAVALAREDADGKRGPRAISRAVREVSAALGNTPSVARASYIDPRVIEAFEHGVVIELPSAIPDAAVPLRIDAGKDQVIIELPTDLDGDLVRLAVEQRVLELLSVAEGQVAGVSNAA